MLASPIAIQRDANGSLLVNFPDIPEAATKIDGLVDAFQALGKRLELRVA